jgi:hypothetical protein
MANRCTSSITEAPVKPISSWRTKLTTSLLAAMLYFRVTGIANAADKLPPVYFWHSIFFLDHTSFQAVRDSPLIAALAGTEFRYTQTNDDSYSGFYLYGRQTFIEFMEQDAEDPPGSSGLGLIVEQSNALAGVTQRLRQRFGGDFRIHSKIASMGNVPWYRWVGFDMEDEFILSAFVQETEPGYLAAIHPEAQIKYPLSRQVYESWRYRPERPLQDVTAISVAIEKPAERSRLSAYFHALGWSVQRGEGGFVATGPNLEVIIEPAEKRKGIREIRFTLNSPVAEQVLELGATKLKLSGTEGQFIFW